MKLFRVLVMKHCLATLIFSPQIAELSDLRDEILTRVGTAVDQAMKHKDSFESYAHLWTDDRQEFLTQFLVYGHVPTQVMGNNM